MNGLYSSKIPELAVSLDRGDRPAILYVFRLLASKIQARLSRRLRVGSKHFHIGQSHDRFHELRHLLIQNTPIYVGVGARLEPKALVCLVKRNKW